MTGVMAGTTPVSSPALSAIKGIAHGFFTREGGVSQGIYQSLNIGIGSDDNPDHVLENRKRVAHTLHVAPDHLLSVYQVHSPDVVTVTKPFTGDKPKADAMVTNCKGLALGILTADCGPVLFADEKAGVIGAAHAGWRGALNGVLENTIIAMEKLGAKRENILAVLGPCIGPAHYEITTEFRDEFLSRDATFARYFRNGKDQKHFFFDFWSFILDRLQSAGVKAESTGLCTYTDEKRFFSYRRKTHRNEPDYGRQISVIVLEE